MIIMKTSGMDESLRVVLETHNPWLREPGTQRAALGRLLPDPWIPRSRKLDPQPGGLLIAGPRQVGKTSLIRHVLARRDDPALVLLAEEPRIRELCRSPAEALAVLGGVLTPGTILFFDEIQHLADAPLFIKGLVDLDPRRRVIVTGSSSFQFRAGTRESLAGRARRVRLLPLSMDEISFTVDEALLSAVREQELSENWRRMLVYGGYPAVWQAAEPATELHHLIEAFVLKDASDLNTIEHPSALRALLRLAAADVGNLVNMNAWAAQAGVSRGTALRYLEIAADAHVVQFVSPFIGGRRAEITGASKLFFLDNGLRNALFGGFGEPDGRSDRGALFENAVFGEICKYAALLDEIHYWRSKNGAEVDFVIRRGGRLIAIEAKSKALAAPGLSRSAHSFIDAYSPAVFAVVNSTLHHDTDIHGAPVRFRRPWEIRELLEI